jgi:uncharacterized membrane protein
MMSWDDIFKTIALIATIFSVTCLVIVLVFILFTSAGRDLLREQMMEKEEDRPDHPDHP